MLLARVFLLIVLALLLILLLKVTKYTVDVACNMVGIILIQECIMRKERSRSVKRPCFNWIFFLPTRASVYTIFR